MSLIIISAWLFSVYFILRVFHISCKPYDNPYDIPFEELEEEICHRCGESNVLDGESISWESCGFVHDEAWLQDGEAVFCEECYFDKDKWGQPYLTDLDEMTSNPHDYLPYGY